MPKKGKKMKNVQVGLKRKEPNRTERHEAVNTDRTRHVYETMSTQELASAVHNKAVVVFNRLSALRPVLDGALNEDVRDKHTFGGPINQDLAQTLDELDRIDGALTHFGTALMAPLDDQSRPAEKSQRN